MALHPKNLILGMKYAVEWPMQATSCVTSIPSFLKCSIFRSWKTLDDPPLHRELKEVRSVKIRSRG